MMAIIYTWSFPTLDVIYNEVDPQTGDSVQNVVTTVHWIYTAVDENYTAYVYGTVGMKPPGQPFIAYADLTPEIVQGWVEDAMGAERVAELQTSLANQIDAQKNPAGGPLPPPWQS